MEAPTTPIGKILLKENPNYLVSIEEGVFRYFEPQFLTQLDHYLKCFEEFNAAYLGVQVDPEIMPDLPFSLNDRTWKERQKDLVLIREELKTNSEILEIGSWNGWLANALSREGHSVTAVDYFLDDLNGLKARKHYPESVWTSLNIDVDDIDLLNPVFDVIIFNRGVSYYSDFEGVITKAKNLLVDNGKIIITGLNVVGDNEDANIFYDQTNDVFKEQYGISMEIKPDSKKMLCDEDLTFLRSIGFVVNSNEIGLEHAFKKYISKKRSRSYTAIYTKA